MASLIFSVLLIFMAYMRSLDARAPLPDNDVFITTGRFFEIDAVTGNQRSLSKHDIERLNDNHHLRFYFDDDLPPIDMHLFQGSVWNKDSVVEVRDGSHRTLLSENRAGGGDCYLHGSVEDSDGAVTINKCGLVTVFIQTPENRYQIEEYHSPEAERHRSQFMVTRRKQEVTVMDQEKEQIADDLLENEATDAEGDVGNNGTDRMKREIQSINIEIIAYLDSNYLNYLYYERNLDTHDKIKNFIITKWGTVQGVYSNPTKIGARVRIDLKRIVFWWSNPSAYPGNEVGVSDRLEWFCKNTRGTDHYDHKVLYTKDVGGHQLGAAYIKAMCKTNQRCALVKSPTENVRVELHEMGHNIGFRHDPSIGGCTTPSGFMAWDNTYRYIPCYKTALQKNLSVPLFDSEICFVFPRNPNFRCLFERNVFDEV